MMRIPALHSASHLGHAVDDDACAFAKDTLEEILGPASALDDNDAFGAVGLSQDSDLPPSSLPLPPSFPSNFHSSAAGDLLVAIL